MKTGSTVQLEAGSVAEDRDRRPARRRRLLLVGGGASLLILAAASSCLSQGLGWRGGGQGSSPGMGWDGTGRMGPNDQRFIVMMIPHHVGAIEMAELALTRSNRPEIKALAQGIKESQTKENEVMRGWYRQWYSAGVPQWGGSYARGTYSGWGGWMGGGGMMGMRDGAMMGPAGGMGMTGSDLGWLKDASEFDRAFIEQMVPHHRMGVMMASMALNNMQKPELRELQQSMIRVQSDEILQMEGWYQDWYGTR